MASKDSETGFYNPGDGLRPVSSEGGWNVRLKKEAMFHSQEREKAMMASPVLACPRCKKPAIGFTGGSNRYPLPPGVPLRFDPVVEMIYLVDGCGCQVDHWWAAGYSKEMTARLHGGTPKAIEPPSKAEIAQAWARCQKDVLHWQQQRYASFSGDVAYAEYRLIVLADQMVRLEAMGAGDKPKTVGKTLMEVFDEANETFAKTAAKMFQQEPLPLDDADDGSGYGKNYAMPKYAKDNQDTKPFPEKKKDSPYNPLDQLIQAAGLGNIKIKWNDKPKALKPLAGVCFYPVSGGKIRIYFYDPNIGSCECDSRAMVKSCLADLGFDVSQLDAYYPPPSPKPPEPLLQGLATEAIWWADASQAAKAAVPDDYKQKQMLEAYSIAKDLSGKSAKDRSDLLAYLAKQPDQGAMHKAVSACLQQILNGVDPGLASRRESGVLVNSGDDRVVGAVFRVLSAVAKHKRFSLLMAAKAWADVPPQKLPERLEAFRKEAMLFRKTRKLTTASQEFVVLFLSTVRAEMVSMPPCCDQGEDPIMVAIAALDAKEKAAEKAAIARKREAFHAQFARPVLKIRKPANKKPAAG